MSSLMHLAALAKSEIIIFCSLFLEVIFLYFFKLKYTDNHMKADECEQIQNYLLFFEN